MWTEAEMAEKWCPEARVEGQYGPVNRLLYPDRAREELAAATKCMASACAHWRWGSPPATPLEGEELPEPRGFCGLSGDPRPRLVTPLPLPLDLGTL